MKKLTLIILGVLTTLLLVSCNSYKQLKGDTPINTGLLIKSALSNKDYTSFNNLFTEDRKNTITKEDFNKLTEISTGGSDHSLYHVITYDNLEILLIKLSPEKVNGEYKVEDVIKLPKGILKESLK